MREAQQDDHEDEGRKEEQAKHETEEGQHNIVLLDLRHQSWCATSKNVRSEQRV